MLKPLNLHIFVKPDKPLTRKGAIILPPADSTRNSGVVVASASSLCKPGDMVVYSSFFPSIVRGHDLVAVQETALIAVDDTPEPWEADPELPSPAMPRLITPRMG